MGPDADSLPFFDGSPDPVFPSLRQRDNYAVHVNGKTPTQVWMDAHAASATRMTFVSHYAAIGTAFTMENERRTPDAPADDEAHFVRSFSSHFYGTFVLTVDTASTCAAGALADALGRRPIVRQGFGPEPLLGTLLDPEKRTIVQDLLVRDGAEVRISLISTRPLPALEALIGATSCGPTDLGACAKLVDDLIAAQQAITLPDATHASLSARNDPYWSATEYDFAELVIVP